MCHSAARHPINCLAGVRVVSRLAPRPGRPFLPRRIASAAARASRHARRPSPAVGMGDNPPRAAPPTISSPSPPIVVIP